MFRRAARKQLPTLRLEIDISTMPPGSPQRLRFEEDFADDLSKILGIRADWVRVYTLRPATGADWMLEVGFQIEADAQTDVAQVRKLKSPLVVFNVTPYSNLCCMWCVDK